MIILCASFSNTEQADIQQVLHHPVVCKYDGDLVIGHGIPCEGSIALNAMIMSVFSSSKLLTHVLKKFQYLEENLYLKYGKYIRNIVKLYIKGRTFCYKREEF